MPISTKLRDALFTTKLSARPPRALRRCEVLAKVPDPVVARRPVGLPVRLRPRRRRQSAR